MSARREPSITSEAAAPSSLAEVQGTPAGMQGAFAKLAPLTIAICAGVLAFLWALDVYVLETGLLTTFRGVAALTPMYAFPLAKASWIACALLVAAAAFCKVAPRAVDPARTSSRSFAALIAVAAVLLAYALFLVRSGPLELGQQFFIYRGEEFIHDAAGITNPSSFLRHYVELMPRLSTHGAHFPPGNSLLLYAVSQTFGPGPLTAGIVVLACASLAPVFVLLALRVLFNEVRARQGALLFLACPSFLDFACTSMDAVFLLVACIAWWLALRAFSERGTLLDGAYAGVALFIATFFSFSAFPLGLSILLYAVFSGRGRASATVRRLAVVGGVYVLTAILVRVTSGFAIWDCLWEARRGAEEFMGRLMASRARADRLHISFGNPVAFAIGAGLALVPAAWVGLRSGAARASWTRAALLTLAIMSFAPIYYLETERIWLFAMPWLAAIAVAGGTWDPRSLRLLLAAGLAQALALEIALFTLW